MDKAPESLLRLVKESPEAVAAHDKVAWMGLFAKHHIVEDPVGSRPHLGQVVVDVTNAQKSPLSRFYDTFIAPNQISFEVEQDIVCADHVVRDLTIHIEMSARLRISVPVHLLYELTEEEGSWKIKRLAAHWELLPMIAQVMKKGVACLPVLASLTWRMLRFQGLSGTLGFLRATNSVGRAGKVKLDQLVKAIDCRDALSLKSVLQSDKTPFYLPFGRTPILADEFMNRLGSNPSISKVLAAGNTVSARLVVNRAGSAESGVIIAEFDQQSKKISECRCYIQ